MDPLIVTAAFDPVSAALFTGLRERHFPPARNIVPAHLTLFHHLPGEGLDGYLSDIAAERSNIGPLSFVTAAPRFLGRGVAITIVCAPLEALRNQLAARWATHLTAQDRQAFRPHVTIQNKVAPADAKHLFTSMLAGFPPLAGTVIGLDLWWYRGGPWEKAGHVAWTTTDGDPG